MGYLLGFDPCTKLFSPFAAANGAMVVAQLQCDQICAIYWTLGNFKSHWQQLICPNLPHYRAIFVKVSKSIIFRVKSFLANFYRHLAIFSGHTAQMAK